MTGKGYTGDDVDSQLKAIEMYAKNFRGLFTGGVGRDEVLNNGDITETDWKTGKPIKTCGMIWGRYED